MPRITVWDVEQRRRVRTLGGDPPPDVGDPSPALVPFAGPADIGLIAVDPAGEHVAALTGVPGSRPPPTSWRGTRTRAGSCSM